MQYNRKKIKKMGSPMLNQNFSTNNKEVWPTYFILDTRKHTRHSSSAQWLYPVAINKKSLEKKEVTKHKKKVPTEYPYNR